MYCLLVDDVDVSSTWRLKKCSAPKRKLDNCMDVCLALGG